VNARERYLAIARFERPNDPWLEVATWRSTVTRWRREGLPADQTPGGFFSLPGQGSITMKPGATVGHLDRGIGLNWGANLDPFYESRILEENGDHVVKYEKDGSVVKLMRHDPESMPQYLEYPVRNRRDWEQYKKRLDPHSPGRWPDGWDRLPDGKPMSERTRPLAMQVLSLYGCPRFYLGLEKLSTLIYDDPLLVEDILEWQTYMGLEMLRKVFAAGIRLDVANLYEDMCCKHGSLVSPAFVKAAMVPRYRKVVDLVRSHGTDIVYLDSDGNIEELLPIWLDCGINMFYPFEVASGMDAIAIRRKYGKNVVMRGTIDKRALAKGKAEIDVELEKAKILLESGGFFPGVDHHIPPDVPFENMVYFVNGLRALSDFEESQAQIEIPVAPAWGPQTGPLFSGEAHPVRQSVSTADPHHPQRERPVRYLCVLHLDLRARRTGDQCSPACPLQGDLAPVYGKRIRLAAQHRQALRECAGVFHRHLDVTCSKAHRLPARLPQRIVDGHLTLR